MSAILIQTTDREFKEILSTAYADGYKKALSELNDAEKNKEWITEEETLKMLHIKKSTLAGYRHNKKITYEGTRGALVYKRKDVERIIADSRINAS